MQHKLLIVLNIVLTLLMALFGLVLQSTVWYQFFGNFPAPLFWLPTIVYFCLYRRPLEGVLLAYIVALMLTSFTSTPLGVLLFVALGIFTLILVLKQRIYFPGKNYYLVVSLVAGFSFHIFQIIFSSIFNDQPQALIADRIIQILLTPVAALPLYYLHSWIDKITSRESLIENQEGQ